jgi:hypothetical protein
MAQVETQMELDMLLTLKRVLPIRLLFQIDQIELKATLIN